MVLALLLSALWTLFCPQESVNSYVIPNVNQTIEQLNVQIDSFQAKTQTEGLPPFFWEHDKGIYKSEVKLNFHGEPELSDFREYFAIYDNNMFATAWITLCLLEAKVYGAGPSPAREQINLAVDAIGQYSNRNINYKNSVMTFWPQKYSKATQSWQSTPGNLLALFDLSDELPIKPLEELLKLLGLQDLEKAVEMLMREKDSFEKAFHIPADFDDTFVNIGLGSLLNKLKGSYPQVYSNWMQRNYNLTSAFSALKRYAYRPFSQNNRINSIDPRTYFYLNDYMEYASQFGDLALVSTWAQDTDEVKYLYDKGVAMPFNINNVDVTVATNTIYGITASLLTNMVKPEDFDEDLQGIYLNTSSMIAYQLSNNFTSRRDLALTYYPSKFECYWFTSRTYDLLRSYSDENTLPFPVMTTVESEFKLVLQGKATSDILMSAHKDESGRIYFDDFLGDNDLTWDNKSINRAEDRIFTTSVAVNTLLRTWTKLNKTTDKLQWQKETPSKVINNVNNARYWLNENVLSGKYKPWNAFFSGSGKGLESMPFVYPANRREFLNGTTIHGDLPYGVPFIYGFEGTVNRNEYNQMLDQMKTPRDFWGFNYDPHGFFPFWSSDAYTYATTMLALSQYFNIS